MITEKKLNELIENRATVLYLTSNEEVREINLKPMDRAAVGRLIHSDDNQGFAYYKLYRIFESRTRLEWYNEHHAKQTILFDPPLYEDIEFSENNLYKYRFYIKSKECFGIIYILNGKVRVNIFDKFGSYKAKDFNIYDDVRENYIKAIDYSRQLFMED